MLAEAQPAAGATSFTRQQAPLGLGHAVWCARELVGASRSPCCCPTCWSRRSKAAPRRWSRPIGEAGEAANVIAVEEVPKDQVSSYGVVGVGERKGKSFRITGMVEKPKPADAPSNLIITGRYILQPEIFDLLETQQKGAGGEIQLTDAMLRLLETQPGLRLPVRGPHLRLRLQARLPLRQRRLCAGARRHRAGVPQGS